MNRGAHRQQVRRLKKPDSAKRKYARDQHGATEIVGGDQYVCPVCGDSPPNLPADARIPKPHPAGMLLVDPATSSGQLLCLSCYFRIMSNLIPALVKVEPDGTFKPHYVIPDELRAMMEGASRPAENSEISENAAKREQPEGKSIEEIDQMVQSARMLR